MKRIICFLLSVIFIFCLIIPVSAETKVISLGRIGVTMPEITVEIKGDGYNKKDISATLDSKKLTVKEVVKYDEAQNSSCAYILVDLSTSMTSSFDLVKRNIVTYIEGLNDNDSVVLLTFGEKTVETVLTGSEAREDAIKAVNELKCDEDGTVFYEALNRAYQISDSSATEYDREYVIAFSDGIDYQMGATTFSEVVKLYDSHTLPLYAACSGNTSKDAADKFGELSRVSGGSFSIVKSEDDFNAFLEELNNVTLVNLKAETNHADGKEKQFSLKIGSSQVGCKIPVIRSVPDNVAPTVKKVTYNVEKDVFEIVFSETVTGAKSNNAYNVTNSKGEKIEVSEVFYSEKDNVYEIKTKTPVYKDSYVFEFSGIKDNSQEANSLSGEAEITVENTNNSEGIHLWIILLIVGAAVAVIIVIIVVVVLTSRKKKSDVKEEDFSIPVRNCVENYECIYEDKPVQEIVKHHIKNNNSARIKLKIKTDKTSEQFIETNIISSLIVGRSDACDVYIDDTKLSRQHFVIENDNGDFYVTDLQSRNGTMLNGIRINSRQKISSGDKIVAGLTDIVITIIGR